MDLNARAAAFVANFAAEPLFEGLEARVWSPRPGVCRVYINNPRAVPSKSRLGFVAVLADGFGDELSESFWMWRSANEQVKARAAAMRALLGLD